MLLDEGQPVGLDELPDGAAHFRMCSCGVDSLHELILKLLDVLGRAWKPRVLLQDRG